ncbi:MAG: hypothetical protein P1V51_02590 [Deltaproteobacteria bacterium]|nr:hypothetical protein [Deltaproteobacteria bacterium]
MSHRVFMERSNERRLPADYRGEVLLWDIDKTYLDTHFSSWRGLARIPFELAVDKVTVPGSVPVLRALRRGAGDEIALTPLYFVSGSPPQLRGVVEQRMNLDAVQFDGITFKDQFGLLLARRFADVKGQVGYKLQALLRYRSELPDGARWLCFGDDVESDAEVFTRFGAVCAGLRGGELERLLRKERVHPDDRRPILRLAEELPVTADPVERIFIHSATGKTPTEPAGRVVRTRSYLQTILVLCQMGKVRPDAVTAVAAELRRRGHDEARMEEELDDAVDRLGVEVALLELAAR